MAGEVCLICSELLAVGETVTVKEKGLVRLKECSLKREDGKFDKSQDLKCKIVHVKCRKTYTSSCCITAAIKQRFTDANVEMQASRCRRSNVPSFDFAQKCLFCAEEIPADFEEKEKKKPVSKRRAIFYVRSLPLRANILGVAENRQDKWGQEVALRVVNVNDLVAVEAKYHHQCMTKFFSAVRSTTKRGRPKLEDITASMEEVYNFLEDNRDECQFSLDELMANITGYMPNQKTVRAKLFEKYGDNIIFAQTPNKTTVMCWRDTGHKLLVRSWYENQKRDEQEERLRIVKMAAAIIREDIRSKPYATDYYPAPDQFLEDVEVVIPETLKLLLTDIITKNKRSSTEKWDKKCTSIAHAVISATRPRSFLSPLQVGLAAFLNRKYGSKDLLNVLSAMGFCSSYNEATLFQVSAIMCKPDTTVLPHIFSQFVFDNADVNISTLDGLNTFHAMGGLQSVTPYTAVTQIGKIKRLSKIPSASVVGTFGHVPLQVFDKPSELGLKNIEILDLEEINPISQEVVLTSCDLLWLYGKSQKMLHIPGWNGFMEQLTSDMAYEKSRIICLPFINSPPSNYDTVYTSLLSAVDKSGSRDGNNKCFVTFDQPLYIKARDIVASMATDSALKNVVVRLGGFHLLMSFMGALGYIMSGSGLKELLSLVYAPVSVEKMLSGHAYARALRGHLLTHTALARIVWEQMDITYSERVAMDEILQDVTSPSFSTTIREEPFVSISRKFQESLANLEARGPTAKLWVQYFTMVTLIKQFVEAERTGNWKLHLECIQKMLPYFHASGHFLYAKSAQLYLQDMLELESKMDTAQFEAFANDGYFTIRRSDKFWSGIWSDMTIEQTLMRMMKSIGGLTHGRGITDSVLAKWILSLSILHYVSEKVEEFSGVSFATSEQHVDMRKSRVLRDMKDIERIFEFFMSHFPFPMIKHIMSIGSGITGDEKINCYNAAELGTTVMRQMIGGNFAQIKFKRSNRVLPLGIVTSGIKVRDETVAIDPLLIFQRISFTKQTDEELKNHVSYELSPFPLSLMIDGQLRKNKKSAAYAFFNKKNDVTFGRNVYVIDGGYLLHRVVWHQGETFSVICAKYIGYDEKYYESNAVIVFDGYPDELCRSIKSAERLRRAKNTSCADVLFDETMTATTSQEKFLSNEKNKIRLISLLSEKFSAVGFRILQAEEDADTLIVNTAIDLSPSYESVIIVGEDVDLLILLAAFAVDKPNVYFLKPGRGKSERALYSANSLNGDINVEDLLFLHGFSGCDTTSALYKQGELKIFKIPKKSAHLRELIKTFDDENADQEMIAEAGERFMLAVYGAPRDKRSLDQYRYECFVNSITKSRFNLASLPPTSGAATEHALRTYLQVQHWRGNKKNPEEWGWKRTTSGLVPVPSKKNPVPQELLKFISCKCLKGCRSACGCRKAGLKCSMMCTNCRGQSCDNAEKAIEMFDDDEEEDILLQNFLSEDLDDEEDTDESDSTTIMSNDDNECRMSSDEPSTAKIQKLA